MPIRRKHFPCGHHGQGQDCHSCPLIDTERKNREAPRVAWKEDTLQHIQAFTNDPINLHDLPSLKLVHKTRHIIQHIPTTKDYRPFLGKRMEVDRSLLSVLLTYRYRLLFRIPPGHIEPLSVMTHETYNHAKQQFVKY